jgi:hypothetical protein
MNQSDYATAWNLITTWGDENARSTQLAQLQSSERRPFVAFAMVKIAAFLANAAAVSEGFCDQLGVTSYARFEDGLLNVTDQVFDAVKPDRETWESLAGMAETLAAKEMAAQAEIAVKSSWPVAPAPTTNLEVAKPSTAIVVAETSTAVAPLESVNLARVRVDQAPIFARVRVVKLGSMDTTDADLKLLGATVITWTNMEKSDDIFAEVEVRGVLTPDDEVAWTIGELAWLSGDAEVEILDPPRYAGQPEDLIPLAQPIQSPPDVGSPGGWPPLIWKSMPLYRALVPLDDALGCVETLLCALSVAPPTFDVQPYLLAGLKARYAKMLREGDLYSEREYRWRYASGPELTFTKWTG